MIKIIIKYCLNESDQYEGFVWGWGSGFNMSSMGASYMSIVKNSETLGFN